MRARNRLVRGLEPARQRGNELAYVSLTRYLVSPRMSKQHVARYAFLQQELGGLDYRLGVKAGAHRAVQHRIRERDQAHPLMVRHVGTDDRHLGTFRDVRRGIVDRLIPAIPASPTRRGQP